MRKREELNHDNIQGESLPKRKKKTEKKVNPLKEAILWVLYLAIVVIISTFIVDVIAQRTGVQGSSMANTLEDGDNVLVEKLSYRFGDPQRYDIIVFPATDPEDAGSYYIKRIIGLPGETVQISGNDIYINGEKLNENYGTTPMGTAGVAEVPMTLGDDEYFVLGDNRDISKDSRYASVGNAHRDDIVGKAFVVIWPLDRIKLLKHQ